MIIGFCDGSCEPVNPNGSIGIGAIIFDAPNVTISNENKIILGADHKELFRYSECFHRGERNFKETSNNVAEYCAYLMAVDFIKKNHLQDKEVVLCGDSKLVINQMNGEWNMNGGIYLEYAEKLMTLLTGLPKIRFMWIPREQNEVADNLSKFAMIKRGVKFKIQPLEKI